MKIKFWGVRGSIPVPGPDTIKFGGNTSCVEVNCGDEIIVIDGGTGLRPLGLDLLQRAIDNKKFNKKISILFSHVHWDHIQGFPFFRPAFNPEFKIHLYGSKHSDVDIECAVRGQMVAPHFPLRLRDMPSKISFKQLSGDETTHIGDILIKNLALNHPNGSFGYKIEHKNKSFVYLSDHEYSDESEQRLIKFAQNSSFIIYDSMYTPEEYSGSDGQGSRKGWGHSTWEYGVELAKAANVDRLVLFHHGREDNKVSEIESLAKKKFKNTIAAFEGLEIII